MEKANLINIKNAKVSDYLWYQRLKAIFNNIISSYYNIK